MLAAGTCFSCAVCLALLLLLHCLFGAVFTCDSGFGVLRRSEPPLKRLIMEIESTPDIPLLCNLRTAIGVGAVGELSLLMLCLSPLLLLMLAWEIHICYCYYY